MLPTLTGSCCQEKERAKRGEVRGGSATDYRGKGEGCSKGLAE